MLCSTVEEENYYLLFPFESLLLLFLGFLLIYEIIDWMT